MSTSVCELLLFALSAMGARVDLGASDALIPSVSRLVGIISHPRTAPLPLPPRRLIIRPPFAAMSARLYEQVKRLYELLDVDGNGRIDRDEVTHEQTARSE